MSIATLAPPAATPADEAAALWHATIGDTPPRDLADAFTRIRDFAGMAAIVLSADLPLSADAIGTFRLTTILFGELATAAADGSLHPTGDD